MIDNGELSRGLEVRLLAASILSKILQEKIPLDDAVEREASVAGLATRDRAFLLLLLLTTFRHLGEIDAVIGRQLAKPLPRKSGSTFNILRLAVVQLLFLETPAHAAIDLAVRSARADRNATHFSGLINALLRQVATLGKNALAGLDAPRLNTPDWLWQRWSAAYGDSDCRRIAVELMHEPALDIAVRGNAAEWAHKLAGKQLSNGHVRMPLAHRPVTELPGYSEGCWWVQDAAAGLPVLLFGPLAGRTALDLCAAPGGKTLQMAAAGAAVTALDISESRLERLRENLARTNLTAEVRLGDALQSGLTETYDAVLLDAPCSATGTIRRHPELPYIKSSSDVASLQLVQRRMLTEAAKYVKAGGTLVYCTCSLEPEEGERQIEWFLAGQPEFSLSLPIGIPPHLVHQQGWLRVLPHMSIGEEQGMDGFFAAALRRNA